MSTTNDQIAIEQIRDVLKLPLSASPAAIVAKVREIKSAADIAAQAKPTSMLHACYVFNQVRILLGLDEDTLPEQILAKVRETADRAGKADGLMASYEADATEILNLLDLPITATWAEIADAVRILKGWQLDLTIERDSADDVPAAPRDLTGTRDHRIP